MLTLALAAALAGTVGLGAPVAPVEPTLQAPAPAPAPAPTPAPAPVVSPPPGDDPSGGTPPPVEPAPEGGAVTAVESSASGESGAAPDLAAEAPAVEDEPAAAEDLEAEAAGIGEPFELQPSTDAEPPRPSRSRRGPSMFGRAWITGGLGASSSHLSLGVGGVYFVIPWVGVGLDLDDTIVFGSSGYNIFAFTPKIVALALPFRRVTPLVQTGFGGAFFNKGLGSYGRWVAGAGLAMAFGRFNLRAGVDFDGLVPDSRFADRFTCTRMSELTGGPCSLSLSPWLGFGFGF